MIHPRSLAEASDPGTLPDRLQTLALHNDARLRERVAANPGAPLRALLLLAAEFPASVAHNPALMLGLLVAPDRLRTAPRPSLAALASAPELPPWLLDALWEIWLESRHNEELGRALLQRSALAPERVRALCLDAPPSVRRRASRHPAAPRDELLLLVRAGSDPSFLHRKSQRPRIAEGDLRRVATLGLWGAELAASHPAAPLVLLEMLSQDPRPSVAIAVAENPSTPPALLARLAERDHHALRCAVARHPSTPEPTLRSLAQHRQREVLLGVIAHPAAPPDLLLSLDEWHLREALAQAPRAPAELLDRLARDASPPVRRLVAANPSTPASTLDRLAHDPDDVVRTKALQVRGLRATRGPKGEPP